jgi:RNA polymerase sigma factor (sigma-70 family)
VPPPFQRFLESHRDEVHRFLRAAVGPDEADDCLQETFVAALRAYPRLRPGSDLRAWVLTIARRKAVDAHRAGARRPRPTADPPEPAAPAADEEPDAELWAEVRRLPDRQRTAIALRFVSDLPYARIAEVMGTSEEAARRSVHEGLRRLRAGAWAASERGTR